MSTMNKYSTSEFYDYMRSLSNGVCGKQGKPICASYKQDISKTNQGFFYNNCNVSYAKVSYSSFLSCSSSGSNSMTIIGLGSFH